MAIRFYQGDSSSLLVVKPDDENINILDPAWKCRMVCTPSENNLQVIIDKYLSKDPVKKVFFTILSPDETMKFLPGRYVCAYELTNEDILYRREIREKIICKPQIVWDKPFGQESTNSNMHHHPHDAYDEVMHHGSHNDPLGCVPTWDSRIGAITQGPRGKDGRSAYDIALANGFEGTQEQWVQSLTGAKGNTGPQGENGYSAYDMARKHGFVGTEAEYLDSLIGQPGRQGIPGYSAYEIACQNGFAGSMGDWLTTLRGPKGDTGQGIDGEKGDTGPRGYNPYQLAKASGFAGSMQEWLDSLVGPVGPTGPEGKSAFESALAHGFLGTEHAWIASLHGADGADGADGLVGATGPTGPMPLFKVENGIVWYSYGSAGTCCNCGTGGTWQELFTIPEIDGSGTALIKSTAVTDVQVSQIDANTLTLTVVKTNLITGTVEPIYTYTLKLGDFLEFVHGANESTIKMTQAFLDKIESLVNPPVKYFDLTVSITGAGRWSIDGGATWLASGTQNLQEGPYIITYETLPGYITPPSETILLNSDKTAIPVTYVLAVKKWNLTVTYTGLDKKLRALTGGWSVDSGTTWNMSGATLNLEEGPYIISYKTEVGFDPIPNESITLDADKTVGNAVYTPSLYTLNVEITGAAGAWSVDDGATWNDGAKTLRYGSYTVKYMDVTGFVTPPSETVTLDNNKTVTANYDVATFDLTVNIDGAAGQWSVDGTTWFNAGTQTLNYGSYEVEYSDVATYTKPNKETVMLDIDTTISGTYTENWWDLTVGVTGAAGEWSLDAGVTWNTPGTVNLRETGLPITVSFKNVDGFTAPADQTITLTADTTITGVYTTEYHDLTVTITGAAGEWTVDGVTWYPSGTQSLPEDDYTVTYRNVVGFVTPDPEDVHLFSDQSATPVNYDVATFDLTVNLTGAAGKWSHDGTNWLDPGTVTLNYGSYNLTYSTVATYTEPLTETVMVDANKTLDRAYTENWWDLTVNITGAAGRWSIDSGANYNDPGTALHLREITDPITVTFEEITKFVKPIDQTINLTSDMTLTGVYTVEYHDMTVTINGPAEAQWSVDGGTTFYNSGTQSIAENDYMLTYKDVFGYTKADPEVVALYAPASFTGTYTQNFWDLTVNLTGANDTGEWSVDGGTTWNAPGATVNLAEAMYDVTFKNVANFTAPTAVIQLRLDAAKTLDAAYTKLFTIGANINIPEGQWKLTTESTWLNGTDTITKPAGTYDVEFKSVKHYQPVATVQYVLDEATSQNDTPYIADGNYVEYPQYNVTVTTNEAGGQWKLNNIDADWRDSATSVTLYEDDAPVTVTYNTIEGFYSPSNEDITTLTEDKNITGTYTAIPEYTLTANITGPVEAKWSIDGTTWNDSGVVLTLYEGTYDVVYKDVPGYAPVATEHVDLNANTVVTATYVMASFALTVNVTGATGAQWTVNADAAVPEDIVWYAADTTQSLPADTYTVTFSEINGFDAPAPIVVELDADKTASGNYTVASLVYYYMVNDQIPVEIYLDQVAGYVDGSITDDVIWPEPDYINTRVRLYEASDADGHFTLEQTEATGWKVIPFVDDGEDPSTLMKSWNFWSSQGPKGMISLAGASASPYNWIKIVVDPA